MTGPTGTCPTCPTCQRRYALNANGTLRTHNRGGRLGQLCPGSREKPTT
jgi:hypothetical protein